MAAWPQERARAHQWLKDAAPSTELRKRFGHDPHRWETFKKRYIAELDDQPDAMETLQKTAAQDTLTLLYAVRAPRPATRHATMP